MHQCHFFCWRLQQPVVVMAPHPSKSCSCPPSWAAGHTEQHSGNGSLNSAGKVLLHGVGYQGSKRDDTCLSRMGGPRRSGLQGGRKHKGGTKQKRETRLDCRLLGKGKVAFSGQLDQRDSVWLSMETFSPTRSSISFWYPTLCFPHGAPAESPGYLPLRLSQQQGRFLPDFWECFAVPAETGDAQRHGMQRATAPSAKVQSHLLW